jgi:hypothetical protein
MRVFLSLVPAPTGVVTYNHRYMPDGRPMQWPPDFVASVIAAATALGLPYTEPSDLVKQYGVEVALKPDFVHYRTEFEPVIGESLFRFMLESLGDPVPAELLPA